MLFSGREIQATDFFNEIQMNAFVVSDEVNRVLNICVYPGRSDLGAGVIQILRLYVIS